MRIKTKTRTACYSMKQLKPGHVYEITSQSKLSQNLWILNSQDRTEKLEAKFLCLENTTNFSTNSVKVLGLSTGQLGWLDERINDLNIIFLELI